MATRTIEGKKQLTDLEKLAIEKLYAKGTKQAIALAKEIERGRARKEKTRKKSKR